MWLLYSFTSNTQSPLTLSQAIQNGLVYKKNILTCKLDIITNEVTISEIFAARIYRISTLV
jgi:hypothetical protein